MSGYSGTPLLKKLGIKPCFVVHFIGAPSHYLELLGPLPPEAQITRQLLGRVDLVHFFSKDRDALHKSLPKLTQHIKQDGMIWVSWPKKSSGVSSTITEDVVREIALPLGLVDVKVCAVDDTWSGLKLVIRRENRKVA